MPALPDDANVSIAIQTEKYISVWVGPNNAPGWRAKDGEEALRKRATVKAYISDNYNHPRTVVVKARFRVHGEPFSRNPQGPPSKCKTCGHPLPN